MALPLVAIGKIAFWSGETPRTDDAWASGTVAASWAATSVEETSSPEIEGLEARHIPKRSGSQGYGTNPNLAKTTNLPSHISGPFQCGQNGEGSHLWVPHVKRTLVLWQKTEGLLRHIDR